MKEPTTEPTTSPLLRMGIAVFFLCCAAVAIAFAWLKFEQSEIQRLEKEKLEAASTNLSETTVQSIEKSP